MITAYKFLGTGAIGLYSGFRWPTPSSTKPGAWMEVAGILELGANGVHACAPDELLNWIDDELWLVELAGQIDKRDGVLLARRGRLLRRLERWNESTARVFVGDCVMRARDAAVDALRRTRDERGARALASIRDLEALEAHLVVRAKSTSGFVAEALAYVADAVALAHGERPERYGLHPATTAMPTAGAIAANLGFVVAHALGCAHADAVGDPAAYEAGVQAERARQRAWLSERLGLDAVPVEAG
jgi:hypothetical protein